MTQISPSSLIRVLSRTAFLAGVAVGLLACGGGESQQGNERAASESASAETVATVVEVTMKDHTYEPSSMSVPAGEPVRLEFENTGSVEHYFVVGDTIAGDGDGFQQNLFSGVSIEKSKQTEGHDEEEGEHDEEHEEGGHENEFELPPGGTGSMTFTLPESKAGTYTIACFETTGGQKHHEMGMKGTLTVTASDGN